MVLIMCLLHRTKIIFADTVLFGDILRNLHSLFFQNIYPLYFFDIISKRFENMAKQKKLNDDMNLSYEISISYFGNCCCCDYPFSSSGWRYGMNGNSGSCRQPN